MEALLGVLSAVRIRGTLTAAEQAAADPAGGGAARVLAAAGRADMRRFGLIQVIRTRPGS